MIDPFEHSISATCRGERCRICGNPAGHKVGEEIPHDKPHWTNRHNFTAYVCCECFGKIFGPIVKRWCQSDSGELSE